jgi:hypothetical protein
MRLIVAGHEACTPDEFTELALGFGLDAELFTGTPDESPLERQARLDARREIVRDLDPTARKFADRLLRSADRVRALTWRAAA